MAWASDTRWVHGNVWIETKEPHKNHIICLKEAVKEISGSEKTTLVAWQEITKEQYLAFVEFQESDGI